MWTPQNTMKHQWVRVCVCVCEREREREREREQTVLDQEVVTVMGWWKAYERLLQEVEG